MPGHKMDRITEDIKRELTAILRQMKDPRINQTLLSIVRVEVTNDLSYANVYISSLQGFKSAKEAEKLLKVASGHVRHQLCSRLDLRHVPTIIFHASDSIEYGTNISKMLNSLKG